MARHLWLIAAPVAALSLAACSFTSLDDLHRGDPAGAPTAGAPSGAGGEGGLAGGGAGATNGTGGAGAGSGPGAMGGGSGGAGGAGEAAGASGAAGQAGAAGGQCGAGATPGFCASLLTGGLLCDDFEAKTRSPAWNGEDVDGEDDMSLAIAEPGQDSCYALHVAAGTGSANERHAMLIKDFGATNSLYCEADLFINKYTSGDIDLMTLAFDVPGFSTYQFAFVLHDAASKALLEAYRPVAQAAGDVGAGAPPGALALETVEIDFPPVGEWVRVRLEVSPDGGARIYYDLQKVGLMEAPEVVGATSAGFKLGITWLTASEELSFGYDNVFCDILGG
jgi:hypothetical protein